MPKTAKKPPVKLKKAVKKPIVKVASLPKELLSENVSKQLILQALRIYQTNQRQGTQSTKTRGEVSYSTRKLYKQKGTGRARHGSRKAPIFVGGGITFGPAPRDFSLSFPKRMRIKSLFDALTVKNQEKRVTLVPSVAKIGPKTKAVVAFLKKTGFSESDKILVVIKGDETDFLKGAGNIQTVSVVRATDLNVYNVVNTRHLVLTDEAVSYLTEYKKKQ